MPEKHEAESFKQARAGLPDVAAHESVIWKPLHRLFQDGNPIDPVTILFYDISDDRRLPFASIARTQGNRLILWPPSDAHEPGEFKDRSALAIHHVTLELANGKTHFTRFDADGNRNHESHAWNLANSEDGLKLWLIGAFSVNSLERQVGALEETVRMPTNDSQRRVQEFERYARQTTLVGVRTPLLRGDCLVTVIHLLPDSASFRGEIKPAHFPMGSFWNDWIDGWSDGDKFVIAPTGINVGGVNLVLLTASPLGHVKCACFLGGFSGRSAYA